MTWSEWMLLLIIFNMFWEDRVARKRHNLIVFYLEGLTKAALKDRAKNANPVIDVPPFTNLSSLHPATLCRNCDSPLSVHGQYCMAHKVATQCVDFQPRLK